MAVLAIVLIIVWLLLVVGLRGYLHARRTGDIALAFRDRRGSAQWWARVISSVGLVFAIAAPLAEIAGMPPVLPFGNALVGYAGVALVVLGIVATLVGQWTMGVSWRGDVDPDVRTELVTTGPYRLVRNPILTATATTAVGLVLMVPNVLSAAMLVCFLLAHQIQVRRVEEPYLRRVHGDAYRDYAARTGRFLPWIGRLSRNGDASDDPPSEGGARPAP